MTSRAAGLEDLNPGPKKRTKVLADAPDTPSSSSRQLTREDILSINKNAWSMITSHLPPIGTICLLRAIPYLSTWVTLDLRPYLIKGLTKVLAMRIPKMLSMDHLLIDVKSIETLRSTHGITIEERLELYWRLQCRVLATHIVDISLVARKCIFGGHFLSWVLRDDPTDEIPMHVFIYTYSISLTLFEYYFQDNGTFINSNLQSFHCVQVTHNSEGAGTVNNIMRTLRATASKNCYPTLALLHPSRAFVSYPGHIVKKKTVISIFYVNIQFATGKCPCCLTNMILYSRLEIAAKTHFEEGYDTSFKISGGVPSTIYDGYNFCNGGPCPHCSDIIQLLRTPQWKEAVSYAQIAAIFDHKSPCVRYLSCQSVQFESIRKTLSECTDENRRRVWEELNG